MSMARSSRRCGRKVCQVAVYEAPSALGAAPPTSSFRDPWALALRSPLCRQRWPSVRQAGSKTRLPSVLPAVAMPTMVPKLTNGSNSLARSAAKPMATATLERRTPGPLTR